MDALSGLYGLLGVSDPVIVGIGVLVSIVVAFGLATLVLEVGRIVGEYAGTTEKPASHKTRAAVSKQISQKAQKQVAGATGVKPQLTTQQKPRLPPATPPKTQPAPTSTQVSRQAEAQPKAEPATPAAQVGTAQTAASSTAQPQAATTANVSDVDVVKNTLKNSITSLEKKYRLNAITLATTDGLVIASTINDPDEEAAIWSGKYNELNKEKPGTAFSLPEKNVYLYLAESAENRVIGFARRPSALENAEIAGLQNDTRKIVDKFAPSIRR